MRRIFCALAILSFSILFATGLIAAAEDPGYHLLKKVVLGGPGNWDYFEVDSGYTHRVFIPRGVAINVVEPDGTVAGMIPTPNGSHGMVFAPEFKRGYTAGKDGSLLIFDPKTLEIIGDEKPPETRDTDFVVYDSGSKRVLTFNPRSKDATAFDAKTGKFMGYIDLSGQLEAGQGDGKGRIFVLLTDRNKIVEFDSKALKVLDTWSVSPCHGASRTGD